MAVEDINGYKPHTDDKINKVNAIKDAEVRLGLIFSAIEEEIEYQNSKAAQYFAEVPHAQGLEQIRLAKQKLKEASMWACRSVFQPEEKY
ncbi:hypothetical protein CkP1_0127 [Citrobacter phage CkP1]|nr:hypothetical protein CkP1_0127 [Citrobacter phage CkP1]